MLSDGGRLGLGGMHLYTAEMIRCAVEYRVKFGCQAQTRIRIASLTVSATAAREADRGLAENKTLGKSGRSTGASGGSQSPTPRHMIPGRSTHGLGDLAGGRSAKCV